MPRPARMTEVTVLIAASLAATALRFVLYRRWVFRRPGPVPGTRIPAGESTAPLPAISRRPTEPNGHRS